MESHPNFYDYGHFSDHSQAQNGSVYEVWSVEDFHYEAGLDVSHFQPVSVFESENGSAESSFTTDFTSSQLTSHNAFGYTENNHSDLTWVPQEATEAYNWLPTSDASAAVVIVPSPNVRPLQLISPSITFQQLSNEDVEPPVYAPQNGFKPLLDGESGEGPLYNHSLNSGEIPYKQPNRTAPSRSRSVTKPKLRVSKFYCNIRPCNYQKAFARKADLKRHLATQHSQLYSSKTKLSQCPWLDCERKGANGFYRRDKMLKHQDRVHGSRLLVTKVRGLDTVASDGGSL